MLFLGMHLKVVTVTKLSYRFFFTFIILNTYDSLIFHAKIQPKISSGSGEEADFVIFAIFSSRAILDI